MKWITLKFHIHSYLKCPLTKIMYGRRMHNNSVFLLPLNFFVLPLTPGNICSLCCYFFFYCGHAAQTELLLVEFKKLFEWTLQQLCDYTPASLMSSLSPTKHLQPTINWLHIDTFCVRPYFVSLFFEKKRMKPFFYLKLWFILWRKCDGDWERTTL